MSAAEIVEERLVYARWSSADIIHNHAEFLQEEDPSLPDAEAWERASADDCLIDDEWDYLTMSLQEKLDEYNPEDAPWLARVENFGWRNLDGQKVFRAENAEAFLRGILPDTECTFNIYVDDETKTIEIQNWHHDSPMGNEWYTITVAGEEDVD